jgi:hypothetical protein
MPPGDKERIEMATKEYRWIQTWCIQAEPGELTPGEVVTVVSSNGAKEVMIKSVFPYETKAGKQLERATVEDI